MRGGHTNRMRELSLDVLFYLLGCGMMAVSTTMFSAPNNIAPGGVSGLAILANYLTGLPIAAVSFAINIPLLLLAYVFLGKLFTLRTLIAVVTFSVMLELSEQVVPAYQGELILAALYGGLLMGFGIALIFMRAATTGGVDIVVRLIQRKRPDFSAGRLMLAVNALVLLLAAVIYGNMESALFALISIFTSSRALDSLLYGQDAGRMVMIMSARHEEIVQYIQAQLERGCTLLSGKGGYTRQDQPVILCAVRTFQYHQLKRMVHSLDPNAFIVALETGEVVGHGFKALPE